MDIFDSYTEGFQNRDRLEDRPTFIAPSFGDTISESASSPERFLDHLGPDSSFTVESNDFTVNPGDQTMPEDLSRTALTAEHYSRKYIKKEAKKYYCSHKGCFKIYNTKGNLKSHQKKHTGEYNFACAKEGCKKRFLTTYELRMHIRVHTKEKPHECIDCDKRFTTLYRLTTHRRFHTGEMMKCEFEGCSKEFNTNSDLKKHLRIHTGERPYQCGEEGCGKTFIVSHHLKKHEQTHTGIRPYVCDELSCYKAFASIQALKHHKYTKHNKMFQEDPKSVCEDIEVNNVHREENTVSMDQNAATVNLSIVAEQHILPTVANPFPYIKINGLVYTLSPIQILETNSNQPITTMGEDISTQVNESSFEQQVASETDDSSFIPVQEIISKSAQMAEICNCPTNKCHPDGHCCQGCPSYFCHDMGQEEMDIDPENSSFSTILPDAPTEPFSPGMCTAEAACQTDETLVGDCCVDETLSSNQKCTKGSCRCCGSACC